MGRRDRRRAWHPVGEPLRHVVWLPAWSAGRWRAPAAARGPEACGPAEPAGGSGGVRPRLSRPECTASGPFFPSLSSRARARARTNSTGCLRHVAAARSQSGGGACGLGTGLSGPASAAPQWLCGLFHDIYVNVTRNYRPRAYRRCVCCNAATPEYTALARTTGPAPVALPKHRHPVAPPQHHHPLAPTHQL